MLTLACDRKSTRQTRCYCCCCCCSIWMYSSVDAHLQSRSLTVRSIEVKPREGERTIGTRNRAATNFVTLALARSNLLQAENVTWPRIVFRTRPPAIVWNFAVVLSEVCSIRALDDIWNIWFSRVLHTERKNAHPLLQFCVWRINCKCVASIRKPGWITGKREAFRTCLSLP